MKQKGRQNTQRVAVAGLGPIGIKLVEALDAGIDGLVLSAVAVRDPNKTRPELDALRSKPPILPIDQLEPMADIVIECAPAALLATIIRPFLMRGKTAIVLSASALLDNADLVECAKSNGAQIVVPTGALIGLDAMTAAAQGTIHSVRMITRKPVRGLLGAPHIVENGIDLEHLREPLKVFEGTARQAARGFPANLNIAVALSLAGIGPDKTVLEVWADPDLDRNTHRIEVDADSASFSMSIANVPSQNPKTGRITALSVIAYLRKMSAPLRVGT